VLAGDWFTQVRELPPWFLALIWSEVMLQLPFFVIGSYAIAAKRNWIWAPAIFYGLFVASTMVCILAELVLSPRTDFARWTLVGFYTPYLLVPLGMAVRMLLARDGLPFPEESKRKAL
jgi:EXPERA (EXPanded EBP superfamily)